MEHGLQLSIPFFGALDIRGQELQQSVPELHPSWTVEAASAISSAAQNTSPAQSVIDGAIFSIDLLSTRGENTADFTRQETFDTFFHSWIPGEDAVDRTILDAESATSYYIYSSKAIPSHTPAYSIIFRTNSTSLMTRHSSCRCIDLASI